MMPQKGSNNNSYAQLITSNGIFNKDQEESSPPPIDDSFDENIASEYPNSRSK